MITRKVFRNKRELIASTISEGDSVLDIGFWGQGITDEDASWPHALLKATGADVYGLDMTIDRSRFPDTDRYKEASAESFSFPGKQFDVLFAGDLIEHLSNPGLFLDACAAHMHQKSRLILTTPNSFNLFNIAEKFTKDEPTVNSDHTMYFNHRTLTVLLQKCGFHVNEISYVYSLEYSHKESWKKKFLNALYFLSSLLTPKYTETLVLTAAR